MAAGDAINELKKKLQPFPHFLQFDVIAKVKSSKCQDILERLLSEKESQHNEGDQYKIDNFISLLYFRLARKKEAFESNGTIRQEYPNNVTALVHLAYMQMISGYEFEANESVKVLIGYKQDRDYDKLIATALAEHGYCLARIAPRFYKSAVEYYEQALKSVPLNFVWKFGCALSSRRCLNVTTGLKMTTDEVKFYCTNAFKHLSDIAEMCSVPLLRAKAWVQLGELSYLLKRPYYQFTMEIVSSLDVKIKFTPEQCFEKALEINDSKTDEFILERCGKFLRLARSPNRYKDTLQECHTYLLRAISLRPTFFSYEHIARILIKMAESETFPRRSYQGTHDARNAASGYDLSSAQPTKSKMSSSLDSACTSLRSTEPHSKLQSPNEQVPDNVSAVTKSTGHHGHGLLCPQRAEAVSPHGCQTGTSHIADRMQQATNRSKFKQARNSHGTVKRLSYEDTRVKDAEKYLKQSIEISKGNNRSAIYCLGLLYRQVGDHHSAMEQFRRITADTDSTAFDKTNAYEQRGYCLLDLSNDSNCSPSDREKYEKQSEMMMMLSIDNAIILVSNTDTMGSEDIRDWQAYPTLKQLLTNDTNSFEQTKKFVDLCTRIGNHKESLVFYDKLWRSNPRDPEILSGIIRSHVRLMHFSSAQACLRLLLCTSEGHRMVNDDPHLINQVYLTTVKHLMMSEDTDQDKDLIKFSCRSAFQHRHGKTCDEDVMNWDVFILDDPDQTDAEATAMESWLKETCGLSVTRNDEEVLAGSLSFSEEVKLITSSRCLVVVLGMNDTKRQEELVSIAMSNQGPENTMPVVVVPVLTSNRDLPLTLRGNQPVRLTQDQLSPDVLLSCFMAMLSLDFKTFQWLV